MKLPWKRSRGNTMLGLAALGIGVVLLALPLMPSLRRYMRMESM